jgi:putative FmdB family regulatory protein
MPIFEYRCRNCGNIFESIEFSSSTPSVCKKCESSDVERLLSVFAVAGGPDKAETESGPCGACGAPRRGMCGE